MISKHTLLDLFYNAPKEVQQGFLQELGVERKVERRRRGVDMELVNKFKQEIISKCKRV